MVYLDNAATSFPKPKGMIYAVNECMRDYCGNPGRSGHWMSMKTGEKIYQTRNELGKLFQISDCSRILFTSNTTEALNLGIKGCLNPGDHAITTSMEHNSVLRPLKALEEAGVETTIVKCNPDGTINIEALRREIKENTRLIVVTHASNITGTIMPIKEIGALAKKMKIPFMVDGAQSAGCLPIDVNDMNIAMLALPGHKGLLGPMGTGMLYVREDINLRPLKEGGTGTRSKDLIQPVEFPEGFEAGTVNAPGIVGLGFSVKYITNIGINAIRAYEESLIGKLDEALRSMNGVTVYGPTDCRKKTGVVLFNLKKVDCEEVCERLSSGYGIACRGGFHCAGLAHKTIGTFDRGAVRLSVGPANTMKDISKAIEAVYQMQKL
ncbi:aminotransferase class V-fold PLP-dependent enzyme [Anoxybacterium hadale]|uniref:Aminotransferase class V-fold PLP-dependent enzyme n=1 Tax=Anoxybacterium hadale TaxID=3408580 RepID=A0ACD1AE84_9FIRM|nr:aminotransferase class V-fold PLP-dependent enzyme [Clostridiales bacterium]